MNFDVRTDVFLKGRKHDDPPRSWLEGGLRRREKFILDVENAPDLRRDIPTS